jgi:hypothetical protein
MTAKSAPSRFFGKKAGTQPPHIAGPLVVSYYINSELKNLIKSTLVKYFNQK